jgi:glycine/D-amino acid oxidase-like deaminating enzyme
VEALGGRVVTRTVATLDEAAAALPPRGVLVNCTGLAARELVPDELVFPQRGQLVHVAAPWVRAAVWEAESEEAYAIPRAGGELELGGTSEDHAWGRAVRPEVQARILRDNAAVVPSLSRAEVRDAWVGLRPCRRGGVRLELEWRAAAGRRGVAVVHNYGHGGAGMCLSYGCADEVVRLVGESLAARARTARL